MKKIFLILSVVLLMGTVLIYSSCKKKETTPVETCSDGILNQGETDIDCGGPCSACQISTYSDKYLGGGSTTGYYFVSTHNGQLFKLSEGNANQTVIDFVYYWSANDGETLASPDDIAVSSLTSFGVSNWTTKNSTRFKTTTLTSTDFQNVSDKNALISAANGASNSEIDNLYPGEIYAFRTHSGKSGLVYIVSRDVPHSAITISMKIEN